MDLKSGRNIKERIRNLHSTMLTAWRINVNFEHYAGRIEVFFYIFPFLYMCLGAVYEFDIRFLS